MEKMDKPEGRGEEGAIRLQKALAMAGVASRREAEEIIAEGRVSVNGALVTRPGVTVVPGRDTILLDGEPVGRPAKKRSYLVYKPKGVLCTRHDPQGRPTLFDVLPPELGTGLHTAGRLDYDAEGLIILTNDGDLTFAVTHPSTHVPKTYLVKLKGQADREQIARLKSGIRLEEGVTQPAEVRREGEGPANSWVRITLREGRKNQVKRMFRAIGHPVIKLVRVAIGPIQLHERMKEGSFRHLTSGEIAALMRGEEMRAEEGGEAAAKAKEPRKASPSPRKAVPSPRKPYSSSRKGPPASRDGRSPGRRPRPK
jgi:23S rRNA pseudouridine2605 synthase